MPEAESPPVLPAHRLRVRSGRGYIALVDTRTGGEVVRVTVEDDAERGAANTALLVLESAAGALRRTVTQTGDTSPQ